MATIKVCGMLSDRSSPPLVIDTLLIISQLARSSPENYECILASGLLPEFRELVHHKEAMVRAKALNCIGNLCRHSTLFYDRFSEPISDTLGTLSVLDGVVSGLSDTDGYVRRFACFAIGNAAFHNSDLYSALKLSIHPLVQNLGDDDEKTRSNAAGALGNLVRNSDELCSEMCRVHAPLELFELALADPSVSSRRIVLFSLGNFCSYPVCLQSILGAEPSFVGQLERLYDDVATDDVSKKNIRRILTKVDGLLGSGGDTRSSSCV
jgi:fused